MCGKLTLNPTNRSWIEFSGERQHGRRDGQWLEYQLPLRPHMTIIISLQSAEFSGSNRGQSGTSSVRIYIYIIVWFSQPSLGLTTLNSIKASFDVLRQNTWTLTWLPPCISKGSISLRFHPAAKPFSLRWFHRVIWQLEMTLAGGVKPIT